MCQRCKNVSTHGLPHQVLLLLLPSPSYTALEVFLKTAMYSINHPILHSLITKGIQVYRRILFSILVTILSWTGNTGIIFLRFTHNVTVIVCIYCTYSENVEWQLTQIRFFIHS
jgi:hypothetical protein